VRLNNALSAIQTTVKPISEIARENGYKCPSRFTERFHNRFKISPDTDVRFLTMTRQKNYALTFQMYVLILKLNWLKWMANQITSIC
jgi:AraC-like DNA-binding protein